MAISLRYQQFLHSTNKRFRHAINRTFFEDVAKDKSITTICKAVIRQLVFLKRCKWTCGITVVNEDRLESHINLERITEYTSTEDRLIAKFIHVVEHETIHAALYDVYGVTGECVVHALESGNGTRR